MSPFPSTSDRLLSPLTIQVISIAATLVQEVPADSGNFPQYMTDSIAVLDDSYSKVVVNVIDLALNWQLFSDVGRPQSFVLLIFSALLHVCLYRGVIQLVITECK